MLAPLCHLLRDDVLSALADPDSNLSNLAEDWRAFLFPDADDAQFADAYSGSACTKPHYDVDTPKTWSTSKKSSKKAPIRPHTRRSS